jgi:hypothetical protein
MYFYIRTFRNMCAVPNMVVFCISLTSWFPSMVLKYYYCYYYYCGGVGGGGVRNDCDEITNLVWSLSLG